jgi:hypothetical protein
MRRFLSITVLALLCAGLLAPTAMATLAATQACCAHKISSAHRHHCSAMDEPQDDAVIARSTACHHCCVALGVTSAPARPQSKAVAAVSQDQHPFITEFYPAESPAADLSIGGERAPPEVSSSR